MAQPQIEFCAALIAGGKSLRMGRDKCLIEVGGRPLWRRQIEILQSLQPTELVISGPLDGSWKGSDRRIVPDRQTNCGPFAGIAAVRESVRSHLVLVLAVDMPRMSATYLRSVLDKCAADSGVVPVRGKLFEPLTAVYLRDCDKLASAQLHTGYFSLHDFANTCLRAGKLSKIDVCLEKEAFFLNLNEPADLPMANSAAMAEG